jgi:ABC-type Na+ efflux pump permease subunit
VLALYTQLLTFGYLLASGVVEEKSSRVVEVLLATIRRATCWPARSSGSACSASASWR